MTNTGRQPAETFTEFQTQQRELEVRRIEAENEQLRLGGGRDLRSILPAQWEALRAPFTGSEIGKLPKGPKGQAGQGPRCNVCGSKHPVEGYFHVDYVGHAHITARLNDIDPAWRMRRSPIQFDTRGMAYMEVELTVLGATHEEVGCADTGLAEWPKLLYSDSLTRAAMRFGIGLDLWKKIPTGGEVYVQGGARAGSSGPGRRSGAPSGTSTTSPSIGVLLDDLKRAVAKIETDGGKAEWADWKDEKGWERERTSGALVRNRELVEEAGRIVRNILTDERVAAGDEPWDPLSGADENGVDGAEATAAGPDPAEDTVNEVEGTKDFHVPSALDEVEGYGDYG